MREGHRRISIENGRGAVKREARGIAASATWLIRPCSQWSRQFWPWVYVDKH